MKKSVIKPILNTLIGLMLLQSHQSTRHVLILSCASVAGSPTTPAVTMPDKMIYIHSHKKSAHRAVDVT